MNGADLVEAGLASARAAALGGSPREAFAPLGDVLAMGWATVDGERARWLYPVAMGALGQYDKALRVLEPMLDDRPDLPTGLQAAACGTAASLLRQIGDHAAGGPPPPRGAGAAGGGG